MLDRLLSAGVPLKSVTRESDPWGGGLVLDIKSADDENFQKWLSQNLPDPERQFSQLSAIEGARAGQGARRRKGNVLPANLLLQATEKAARETDWTRVPRVEDVKEGLVKIFRVVEGPPELEDSEGGRLQLLQYQTDVCYPAAERTEAGETVQVWRIADVEEGDTVIPFGGEGVHLAGRIRVDRPTVPNCITAWIWTMAHDRARYRAALVEAQAELLDPTPPGSSESAEPSSPTS